MGFAAIFDGVGRAVIDVFQGIDGATLMVESGLADILVHRQTHQIGHEHDRDRGARGVW